MGGMVVEMGVILSVVADGGWMVVVLAVGVGVVLAADDGRGGVVVASWYRLMLVTVLKVVVVVAAAMVKVALSSLDLSSGLFYHCLHQLCCANDGHNVSVLSKPTGCSPFCCLLT